MEAVRKQATTADTLTMARDLATEIQDRLQARQDTLIGLVITEQGIAATQIGWLKRQQLEGDLKRRTWWDYDFTKQDEGMSEEELRKRYLSKRKRDIALYTNAMNRKKCVSVVETMNSLPAGVHVSLMARSYYPFEDTKEGIASRYHNKLNHVGSNLVRRTLQSIGIECEKEVFA